MLASDPKFGKRTWQDVLDTMTAQRQGDTRNRWLTVAKDKALKRLWACPLIQTTLEQLLRAMQEGTVSTNVYLRRLHNFALEYARIPSPIIPSPVWPPISHGERRAITFEEHRKIVEREGNPERRAFYQLGWELGGSQTDMAMLCAENFNWLENVLAYTRKKSKTPVLQTLSAEIETILKDLPQNGPLFPYLRNVRSADRATEFKQRCSGLGIKGVSLHSYRYAWAERARRCGYPERFGQEALGHASAAIHRAYAKSVLVELPPLEEYERGKFKVAALPKRRECGQDNCRIIAVVATRLVADAPHTLWRKAAVTRVSSLLRLSHQLGRKSSAFIRAKNRTGARCRLLGIPQLM
jgi:integrase